MMPLSRFKRDGKVLNPKPEDLPNNNIINELSGERPEMRILLNRVFISISFLEVHIQPKKLLRMSRIFLLSVAFVAKSVITLAQSDTLQGKDEDVIVTANKLEQKQNTTGKVVTVITKEQIEKSSGKTVAQVLNEQAGIVVPGAYNTLGSVQTVLMRGASTGRTLILVDGIPVSDPSYIDGGYDLNFFSLNNVDRIEISKGAQSTLYGSDAISGVINIITNKNNINKKINVNIGEAIGNLNTIRGSANVFGKISKLFYSVKYEKIVTNGFSSAYDSSGKKDFDKDGYNGSNLSVMLQYSINDYFSVKTFTRYSQYKADVDASGFVDDKDFTINNKSFIGGAGFQFKNDIVSVTGNYQYNELNRNFLNDSNFISGFSKYESNKYYGKTQYVELYTSIKMGKRFTLLQGADYRYGLMNNDYISISDFGPYSSQFKDTAIGQASIYGSILYNSLNKKLNIELGGRLNLHSRYGDNYTYTFNPSYNINKYYRIFGSVATGFKAPSLYQLYDAYSGNGKLLPEKSINYEVGVQQTHSMMKNRLVFFYREIKNGIDYDYMAYKYFNFVKQIVRGVEYEAFIRINEKMNITGNYTFLSADERSQNRVNFKDTSYNYLLRRPKHNINLTTGYNINNNIYISISGKYVSSRNDVGGYQKSDVVLKDYFILNAYGDYKLNQKMKLFIDMQNITNTKFFDINGYNGIPFLLKGGITLNL